MDTNWSAIKEEIKRDIGDAFLPGNPAYPNIDEGILLFQRAIYSKAGSSELAGLRRIMPASLHEAFISKIGQLEPLRMLADCFEPYLKKIAVIANLDTTNAILSKQLIPLLKLLDLNSSLTTQASGAYPQLTLNELPNYTGAPQYLESICSAYLTRNTVHESPDWNRKTVIEKLTHLLIAYIYTSQKFKSDIENTQDFRPETSISEKIGDEQKYLYYFISFGTTTNQIRNQVITSYVLTALQEKGAMAVDDARKLINTFFSTDLNSNYYQNLLQKLVTDKKVSYDKQNRTYHLCKAEVERLNAVQKNFEENKKIFFLFLEDIARKYEIIPAINQLFDKLQEFIENNYQIDVAEAYDRGVSIKNDDNQAYQNFVAFLQSLLPAPHSGTNLFKDLIELSRDSDFLLRMCASKAFANLTNPDRFEQYIHLQERVVYLDTQIILYILCLNYVPNADYRSIYYETAEELINLAKKNSNIKLKVSRLYLQEVAYQLKLALLLIPFEAITTGKMSSNVFFQFYWHLKENHLLVEGDETFSDFMYSWLNLLEEDAYDSQFHSIAYSILYNLLGEADLNISVETLPQYDNKNQAVEILSKELDQENFKFRPKNAIDNDAIMMCHLCNGDLHPVEPFFLTWDKMFAKFRKAYLEKYMRANTLSFHLFNPARFLNHYSLINLKINTKALTDDFISIMDSNNVHTRTQTIWDSINRFLNIDNLNSSKRRRYVNKIKLLFENELDYSIDDFNDIDKANRILQPFEDILSKINDHFSYESDFNITDYRNLLLSEESFTVLSELIFSDVVAENSLGSTIIADIESLIQNSKRE